MALEGIVAVQQRVAAIEQRLAALRAAPAPGARPGGPVPAGAATTAGAVSFAQVLAGMPTPGGLAGPSPPPGSGGPALTPATKRPPGAYGRLEPPPELARYGNGRVPPSALTPLGEGDHRLWGPAAAAFGRLAADARAAGVELRVTDSYRPYDEQVALAARKGLYSEGGLAARPGTSNHGWGLSLDLDLDAAARRWMRDHAHRYGFAEDVPREPWHWTYRPD